MNNTKLFLYLFILVFQVFVFIIALVTKQLNYIYDALFFVLICVQLAL